jgi:hypothetical protein
MTHWRSILAVATGLGAMACRRVGPGSQDLTVEFATVGPAHVLPRALGEVVGVTTSPQHPNWAQIWLVDPEGTIRAYYVNFNGHVERGLVITRN